jgi:hypothetical protein
VKKDESKYPEDFSVAMLRQGILLKMPLLPCCAMRDGHFFKYWVYILGSRTGTLYVGMTGFFDTRRERCDHRANRERLVSSLEEIRDSLFRLA